MIFTIKTMDGEEFNYKVDFLDIYQGNLRGFLNAATVFCIPLENIRVFYGG